MVTTRIGYVDEAPCGGLLVIILYCVSYVYVCTYDIALVQLSYVISLL